MIDCLEISPLFQICEIWSHTEGFTVRHCKIIVAGLHHVAFRRKKSSNAVLSAREERESMMGPAQRNGEGGNGFLVKDVFLCHSGKQKIPVRELHKELTNKGVSCFFDEDPQRLPLAEKFPARIFEAAEKCRIAVLVISKDFIHSKWPMLELSALLKAKSSGKNPHMKILPLFFMLSPNSLSDFTVDNQAWKDLGISDQDRVEWHSTLKEIKSIKGLVFKEVEDVVGFTDEVVKSICSLLLPHIPSSMQGHARQDPLSPPFNLTSGQLCFKLSAKFLKISMVIWICMDLPASLQRLLQPHLSSTSAMGYIVFSISFCAPVEIPI
ncbi:uncharacterized protein LOC131036401 isoform X1 [Cryptomeria japonica]|uniref:uncharacterized protein LOC131036401 isoform X1 n=1 Tax=Cryptomeria japonica TaxID=3369 RepID=UPI0025AD68E7|nr:uncharacterized protein LOC131036401 isoform X1 [Cryptomeria japonica]